MCYHRYHAVLPCLHPGHEGAAASCRRRGTLAKSGFCRLHAFQRNGTVAALADISLEEGCSGWRPGDKDCLQDVRCSKRHRTHVGTRWLHTLTVLSSLKKRTIPTLQISPVRSYMTFSLRCSYRLCVLEGRQQRPLSAPPRDVPNACA